MIFAFVRSLIGDFGRLLMDFYIANSLLINSMVLIYGLLVFISRRNYYFILEKLIYQIRDGNSKYAKSGIKKITKMDYENIQWNAIRSKVPIPFFTLPRNWALNVTSTKRIQGEFTLQKINALLANVSKTNKG